MPLRLITFTPFMLVWVVVVHTAMQGDWQWLQTYLPFSFMGIIGAIFANSTGAGGGVVFIPAFQLLGFSEGQSVGTSVAIQCMGMTAGSLSWLALAKTDQVGVQTWKPMGKIVLLTSVFSVAGINLVYGLAWVSPASLKQIFAVFSLILGSLLLFSVSKLDNRADRIEIDRSDILMLVVIGLFGGLITAWLSVGVGEILALYLLLRGFSAAMSVAAAVCVSAISVWSGIGYHVLSNNVVWDVLVFAGPAAIIGGSIARYLALWLPPRQLKIFFSCWVLFMGLVSSPLFS